MSALWMIRKKTNHLIGPIETDQVVEMVKNGHLEEEDEICKENGYWFFLHEISEVKRHLGVDTIFVRRRGSDDNETTIVEELEPTLLSAEPTGEEMQVVLESNPDLSNGGEATRMVDMANGTETMQTSSPAPAPMSAGAIQKKIAEINARPALSIQELNQKFQRSASSIMGIKQSEETFKVVAKVSFFEKTRLWVFFVLLAGVFIIWGFTMILKLLD